MKEEKKRKEVQIRRWKKNQRKRAESGSPETAKGLRIPEAYSTAKTGLRQLKGKHQKTQETKGRYVLLKYKRSNKKKEKA